MFVDSHAHLEMEQFDADREQVISRARQAGIQTIVAIGSGTGPGSLDCGIQLADRYEFIHATIGIHPHEAKLAGDTDFVQLEELAKHPKVIAWGEVGLDYYYDHSPREIQKQVFLKQMELARAAKLPIVIHCRPSEGSDNAWEDSLDLIEQHWASSGLGGILHCFTGVGPQAKRALDMGFMISFAGNVTFFLAPVPNRGKRNEPAFVKETARKLGELLGLSMEEIGEQTSRNFYNFFKISETVENKIQGR